MIIHSNEVRDEASLNEHSGIVMENLSKRGLEIDEEKMEDDSVSASYNALAFKI